MAKTLSNWIKTFNDCEIPVLNKSKSKLQDLQENEQDITVTVLANIARQDPGFSINILRHACKSNRREITTLSHAISLIGIPLVVKMLLRLPELEKTLNQTLLSKVLNEYSRQYFTAFIAKEWSQLRKESENQEIYTAALNRGFVRFILYFIDSDKAIKLEKIYLAPDENHKIKEKELLGSNVDEIAQAIAKNWNLPELIRENYSGKHHNPKITGIRLVAELLRQIYSHSSIQYPEELINRVAEYIRIPVDQTPGKINSIIINAIRNSEEHIPCHPLLQMMMYCPSSIKKENIETKIKIKKLKGSPGNVTFTDYIEIIRSKDTDKSTQDLIAVAIKALKDGIGFSRAIFMQFDTNEKCLGVKVHLQDKELPNIKQLRISMELNKLYSQLLKKEQTLCINPKNQHKYSHLLPEKLRPLKSSATIILNSFYVNNRIIGSFYVDYGNKDKLLTPYDLKLFKAICTELKTAIEFSIENKKAIKKVA